MSDYNNVSERPSHHIHKDSEPLPGTGSVPPPPDYNPSTIDRMDSSEFPPWNDTPSPSLEQPTFQAGLPIQERTRSAQGDSAIDDERPMDVKSTPAGPLKLSVQFHRDSINWLLLQVVSRKICPKGKQVQRTNSSERRRR